MRSHLSEVVLFIPIYEPLDNEEIVSVAFVHEFSSSVKLLFLLFARLLRITTFPSSLTSAVKNPDTLANRPPPLLDDELLLISQFFSRQPLLNSES